MKELNSSLRVDPVKTRGEGAGEVGSPVYHYRPL